MRRDMDRLFQYLDMKGENERAAGVFPLMNVTEDDEQYFVRAELPGIEAKELNVTTTNNRLSVSGRRELAVEAENASYHRRERDGGTFNRSVSLPGGFDGDRVSATYTDGILTIQLPKSAAQRPRQISVATA